MSKARLKSKGKQSSTLSTKLDLWHFLLAGVLVIAIMAAYAPLMSNSFIDYDDTAYISGNSHVRAGLTFATWRWAWTSLEAGNWHPLTWISHALDVDVFGVDPAGHHFTSLLIHILNTVLLYLLLSCVTVSKEKCLAVAGLFAVHPLVVESVSWAAERKNVLCALFFLLTIGAYGWYVRRPGATRYLVVALTFSLGLCAKPMVITIPFVLLLLDFWPLGRVEGLTTSSPPFSLTPLNWKKLVLEKLPLLALSVGSAIITLIAQSSAGAVASTQAVPLTARIANACYSYFAYVLKILWPVGLAPFYPKVPLSALQVGLALLFVAGVSVIVWMQRSARPYLIVGWLFYLGTLVPVIGLVQVGTQAMADRYAYIPMIGVFIAIVWFVADLSFVRNWRIPVAVMAATAILLLVIRTRSQVRLWHDDITLWSYCIAITGNNPVAEDNLGIALLQQGRTQEALPHFYRATELNPDDPISAANVATDLLAHGQTREAIAKYEAALSRAALVPMLLPNIHSNLGSAYLSVGDLTRARDHYAVALALNPDDQRARAGLIRVGQPANAASPK